MSAAAHADHRAFLNRYYGAAHRFYDLTRKYYLFGRDATLAQLGTERWGSLVEVGPGTGRNLRALHRAREHAHLFGVEASDAMLAHAQERCPFAIVVHGYAEDVDYRGLVGSAGTDRILFSYSLSMMEDPIAALANARRALARGGQIVIVDFGDLGGLARPLRRALRGWLGAFRVTPVAEERLRELGARIAHGPGRYFLSARIHAERPQATVS